MPEDEVKLGRVINCEKLNVRENSNLDATVICELEESAEVMIDLSFSTDDFYKVYMAAGIEGFCMKKYISI